MQKDLLQKNLYQKLLVQVLEIILNFKDIQIFNDKMGKPYFLKSKKIDKIIKKRFKIKKYNLFLSISDEKDYSIAFTILQKK